MWWSLQIAKDVSKCWHGKLALNRKWRHLRRCRNPSPSLLPSNEQFESVQQLPNTEVVQHLPNHEPSTSLNSVEIHPADLNEDETDQVIEEPDEIMHINRDIAKVNMTKVIDMKRLS
ncbi:hypothetical protein TNCV_4026421 [Trichonephila clavipes]|nr:hypothetical protein TNCV_4026421 [Trichonephila clavipes]